jgi:hypothetical protein
MIGEEILLEIDSTLDRLIRNAEAMQTISFDELSEIEADAFQKTQESLLHHLIYMDRCLETKTQNLRIEGKKSARAQIQEKKQKFEKLKASYHTDLHTTLARKSDMLSKRRGKRLISTV